MKKILFFILILFFCATCFAQQTKDSIAQTTENESHPEHPAEFPGGNQAWRIYLQHHLNYSLGYQYLTIPKGEKNAKQTVKLSFEIDTEGHTSSIVVENKEDVHPELAKEGIRIIAESPVWKAASQYGKNVSDKRRQKITFMKGFF